MPPVVFLVTKSSNRRHQYTHKKGFCEDLDEGKYSFILIHALENASYKQETLLENMLLQRRGLGRAISAYKGLTLALVADIGSFDFTTKALGALRCELEDKLRVVESRTDKSSPVLWHMLEALRV